MLASVAPLLQLYAVPPVAVILTVDVPPEQAISVAVVETMIDEGDVTSIVVEAEHPLASVIV